MLVSRVRSYSDFPTGFAELTPTAAEMFVLSSPVSPLPASPLPLAPSSSSSSGVEALDPRLRDLQISGADVSGKSYAHLSNSTLLTKCFLKEIVERRDDMLVVSVVPEKSFKVLAVG